MQKNRQANRRHRRPWEQVAQADCVYHDRLEGILEIVDIPSVTEHRRSIFTNRSHWRHGGPKSQQWTMQHLHCFDKLCFEGNRTYPHGWSIWEMYIAHHARPHGTEAKWGPKIDSTNLGRFIESGRIEYVVSPCRDVTKDLDDLENFIAKCDERLALIGEWVRLDLCMCVRCACGREAFVNARETFRLIPAQSTTIEVVKRMRCSACGAADVDSTVAYYRDGNSAFWKYSTGSRSHSRRAQRHSLDELYVNASGDGENPAYLGDGLYVDPDGTLHE